VIEDKTTATSTLYINDVAITDGTWTYATWFATTGWPETWEIEYNIDTGETEYTNWITVKIYVEVEGPGGGTDSYTFEPYHPRMAQYLDNPGSATEWQWQDDDVGPVSCEGGGTVDELACDLSVNYQMTEYVVAAHCHQGSHSLMQDNIPTGSPGVALYKYNPLSFSGYGIKFGGTYNTDCGQVYSGDTPGWIAEGGLTRAEAMNTHHDFAGLNWMQDHCRGTNNWEATVAVDRWAIGPCEEDLPLDPIVCAGVVVNRTNSDPLPVSMAELVVTFDTQGSQFESLFAERGYPRVHGTFGIEWTGIAEGALY
jgi:hypothetical protein